MNLNQYLKTLYEEQDWDMGGGLRLLINVYTFLILGCNNIKMNKLHDKLTKEDLDLPYVMKWFERTGHIVNQDKLKKAVNMFLNA